MSLDRLLVFAIQADLPDRVRSMATKLTDVDVKDPSGKTALFHAVLKNRLNVCRVLCELGANPLALTPAGVTILDFAESRSDQKVCELLKSFASRDHLNHQYMDDDELRNIDVLGEAEQFWSLDFEPEEDVSLSPSDENFEAIAGTINSQIGKAEFLRYDDGEWDDILIELPQEEFLRRFGRSSDDEKDLVSLSFNRSLFHGQRFPHYFSDSVDGFTDEDRIVDLSLEALGLSEPTDEIWPIVQPIPRDEVDPETFDELTGYVSQLHFSSRSTEYLYQVEAVRSDLLDAEQEIVLAKSIEDSQEKILFALSSWRDGLLCLDYYADMLRLGELRFTDVSRLKNEVEGLEETSEDESFEDESIGLSTVDKLCFEIAEIIKLAREDQINIDLIQEKLRSLNLKTDIYLSIPNRVNSGIPSSYSEALKSFRDSRDRFVVSNLRLSMSIARQFSNVPNIDVLDLIQEGNLGLALAAERFDWRQEFRFSTYATWWIRQRIFRYISDHGRTVRLPVHIDEKVNKFLKVSNSLLSTLGREPRESEIYEKLDFRLSSWVPVHARGEESECIDEINLTEDCYIGNINRSTYSKDPIVNSEFQALRRKLEEMFIHLKDTEQEIIKLRFGWSNMDGMTLEEIGQIKGVTRERIRQIETKAFTRLNSASRREILKEFLDNSEQY